MNVSDSCKSSYCGRPLSVLRVMAETESCQPSPNGPLPEPESYASDSFGPKPERPGEVMIGTIIEPVPVTGLAANFSPMPRMAPPPLGSASCSGALVSNRSWPLELDFDGDVFGSSTAEPFRAIESPSTALCSLDP